jgi:hypothetical protein
MHRIKPGLDIVLDILHAVNEAKPSPFIQSLLHQYQERGGLSKKQLEGLFGKASKVNSIAPAKLATLEAIIMKKPTRFKSNLPGATPLYTKDEELGKMLKEILAKYPLHKRVLYFQAKYDNNDPLSSSEITEVKKFYKMLE